MVEARNCIDGALHVGARQDEHMASPQRRRERRGSAEKTNGGGNAGEPMFSRLFFSAPLRLCVKAVLSKPQAAPLRGHD
jgi:hypothetical protein